MYQRAIFVIILLALLLAAPAAAAPTYGKLFYGDINNVDRIPGPAHALEALGGFSLLVLREPAEYDAAQRRVVDALKAKDIPLFGYIHIAVIVDPITEERVKTAIDHAAAGGYYGIFFDEAGYDYHVDRARFNRLAAYAHAKGLKVMANAWMPEDVLDSQVHKEMNPTGEATALGPGDWVLLESFYRRSDDAYADMPDSMAKYERTVDLAHARGVSVLGLAYHGLKQPYTNEQDRVNAWYLATMLGLDAFAYGTDDNEVIPWRSAPPLPSLPAGATLGPLLRVSDQPLRWERTIGPYLFWFEASGKTTRSAGYYRIRSDGGAEMLMGLTAPLAYD